MEEREETIEYLGSECSYWLPVWWHILWWSHLDFWWSPLRTSFSSAAVIQDGSSRNELHSCSVAGEPSRDVSVGLRLIAMTSLNLPVNLHRNTRKMYCMLPRSARKHNPKDTIHHCFIPRTHHFPPQVNHSKGAKTHEEEATWENLRELCTASRKSIISRMFPEKTQAEKTVSLCSPYLMILSHSLGPVLSVPRKLKIQFWVRGNSKILSPWLINLPRFLVSPHL